VRSAATTTRFAVTSTYHPWTPCGALAAAPSSVDLAASSARSLRSTTRGCAPAARTMSAAPASVTATMSRPAVSQPPAYLSPRLFFKSASVRAASASRANRARA
jgi:hypothetical protein